MSHWGKPDRFWCLLPAFLLLVPLAGRGEEAPVRPDFTGSLRATYDYRKLGDSSDQDGYGIWYLRGRNLANKRVEIYTSGRLHQDIDGEPSGSAYDPFGSLDDSTRSDLRLLQCYIDLHDPEKKAALRLGRQYVDVADYIQIDGSQLMLFENRTIGGRAFFGVPVSDYTSIDGDLFGGVSLVGRPWQGNQSRVTYAQYHDSSEAATDDNVVLDLKQQMTDEMRSRAYLSIMNEDIRMGGLDLYYISLSDYVFDAVLGVRRWGDYDAETRAYSPLVDALDEQEPFTTAYGRFTSEITSWLYLSPGVQFKNPDETDATNRRFGRYDLSFIVEPTEPLTATVALEYWNVEESDSFLGLSGDIRYRHGKIWELALGAAYVDYTYYQLSDLSVFTDDNQIPAVIDPLDGTRVERSPNAFTYFLRGKWNLAKHVAVHLAGEIEDDSDEDDLGYRLRTSLEVRL